MSDCLSEKEIKLLSSRKLHGRGLFAALKHLESCENCRSQIKLPTKEEILERFQEDESAPAKAKSLVRQK